MSKPYIHPDIILRVRQSIGTEEKIDTGSLDEAKQDGEQFAEEIIKKLFAVQEYGNIESHFNTEKLNSKTYASFREQIINIHYQSKTVNAQLLTTNSKISDTEIKLLKLKSSLFRFFFKKKILSLSAELEGLNGQASSLKDLQSESFLNITYQFEDERINDAYSDLCSAFTTLRSASKLWDVTTSQLNLETKAAASTSITRNEVHFDFGGLDTIKLAQKVLHIENYNGGDFYLYPNFVIYFKTKEEIAIIDYNDIYLEYSEQRFLEEKKTSQVIQL